MSKILYNPLSLLPVQQQVQVKSMCSNLYGLFSRCLSFFNPPSNLSPLRKMAFVIMLGVSVITRKINLVVAVIIWRSINHFFLCPRNESRELICQKPAILGPSSKISAIEEQKDKESAQVIYPSCEAASSNEEDLPDMATFFSDVIKDDIGELSETVSKIASTAGLAATVYLSKPDNCFRAEGRGVLEIPPLYTISNTRMFAKYLSKGKEETLIQDLTKHLNGVPDFISRCNRVEIVMRSIGILQKDDGLIDYNFNSLFAGLLRLIEIEEMTEQKLFAYTRVLYVASRIFLDRHICDGKEDEFCILIECLSMYGKIPENMRFLGIYGMVNWSNILFNCRNIKRRALCIQLLIRQINDSERKDLQYYFLAHLAVWFRWDRDMTNLAMCQDKMKRIFSFMSGSTPPEPAKTLLNETKSAADGEPLAAAVHQFLDKTLKKRVSVDERVGYLYTLVALFLDKDQPKLSWPNEETGSLLARIQLLEDEEERMAVLLAFACMFSLKGNTAGFPAIIEALGKIRDSKIKKFGCATCMKFLLSMEDNEERRATLASIYSSTDTDIKSEVRFQLMCFGYPLQ